MGDERKVIKRALTQKYDMAQLHALTHMEDEFMGKSHNPHAHFISLSDLLLFMLFSWRFFPQ